MRLFILILVSFVVVEAGFFDFLSEVAHGASAKIKAKLKPVTDDLAKKYLQNFGYVGPSNSLSGSSGMAGDVSDSNSIFKRAIAKFQQFAGLKQTGNLDEPTKLKMAAPRCGAPDVLAISSAGTSAFKWKKTRLTYSIENFSSDLPKDQVRAAIRGAYDTWAAVTPLEFEEVSPGQGDIKVRFGVRNHNDPWPFDGEGGVLAHATMPDSGMLHFDDDESWAYMDPKKIADSSTDLLAVAIHEGGHTLGLQHSRDENAIMAPFYQSTVDSRGNYHAPTLKSDDINAVQDIYGARTSGRAPSSGSGGFTTPRTSATTTRGLWDRLFGHDDDNSGVRTTTFRPTTRSSFFGGFFGGSGSSSGSSSGGGCPHTIDAYAPSDSFSYLFSGSQVYAISGTRVQKVHQLRTLFPDAPIIVQAAVFNPLSGMMLLFSNGRVYGYTYSRLRSQFQLDSEYPKTLPSDIDFRVSGAIRWINGHQILLSSGIDFSVYDEYWNRSTLQNTLPNYFTNFPKGVKGMESPSGSDVTLFTSSRIFKYNSRSKQVTDEISLSNYLQC